jgi:hypothetical protein
VQKVQTAITQEAWTRVDLDTMAQRADEALASSYPYCFLLPTYHIHATALGLESRLQNTETGYTFGERTESEARNAALYGHALVLRLLKLQNSYFGLGLLDEIEQRWAVFPPIWEVVAMILQHPLRSETRYRRSRAEGFANFRGTAPKIIAPRARR